MNPASAAFRDAIKRSHVLAVRVEVLTAGVVVRRIDSIDDGSVTLDARAATRGRLDNLRIVVADGSDLVPTTPASLLAPYGNEVRVSRGIRYPDVTEPELMPLGVFRIEDADVDDSPDGLVVQITGMDRSARIIDARFEAPYEIAAGTNVETAILATAQQAMPDVVFVGAGLLFTTPLLRAAEGDDPWAFMQDIATACGMTLFFDGVGQLRLASTLGGLPVTTLAEGEGGVLLTAARRWGRTGAFNRVIVTGENTGLAAPARGVATDTDPLSPTYYYGPFGRVPRFYSSPFITTDAQADTAAIAMLTRELGTTQEVSFGTIVDPSLEPGDVARITRTRAGIDEDHIIDQLTIPLSAAGAMSGQTRGRLTT